jgi:hypothetical protein
MKKKIIGILICMLLIATMLPATGLNIDKKSSDLNLRLSEALIPPDADKIVQTVNLVPEPGFYETNEYMIGSIAVGEIFLESIGGNDPSTENWTPVEELNVQMEIGYALNQWWAVQNPNAQVSFVFDCHTAVPTTYEPIIHPSGVTDDTYEKLWVNEAMAYLGYTSGDWMARTRTYINNLRQSQGTDWAFTIFIIDSTNDFATDPFTPGSFSDNYWAYGYWGGPFCVLTYDNGLWGISRMDQVLAHETGHIFWATDEYNKINEYSGYLNAMDKEGSGCLMDTCALSLSTGTKQQIGWKDTDGDGILDIIDTNPDTNLIPYTPDPTTSTTLIYSGSAIVVPYPNNNPNWWNSGNDVTINTISNVQYRVNGGSWQNANPVDGSYDSYKEHFTMTIGPLTPGTYTIETQAINSVGNYELTPSSDTVTITAGNTAPNKPSKPSGTTSGKINTAYTYTTSTTDPDGNQISYWFDWGDGANSGWVGPYASGANGSANHTWTKKGNYQITVKAKDTNGAESDWSDPLSISMPKTRLYINNMFQIFFEQLIHRFPFFEKILNQIL